MSNNLHSVLRAAAFGSALLVGQGAGGAPIDIADVPLITPGTSQVKPNLNFILDNSGSMNWDYLPDYVVDEKWCRDANAQAGSGASSSGRGLMCCRRSDGTYIVSSSDSSVCLPQHTGGLRGMPLFHAYQFNTAYYNPAISYTAPKNANGTSKTSYTGGSTPWDGYGKQSTGVANIALTSDFPDVEWCTDTTYTDCLRADNYLVPGTVNGKAYTTMRAVYATGSKTFVGGSPAAPTTATRAAGPYYYTIVPGEYCTTIKLTDCINSFVPTTVGGKNYVYPAAIRWCNNADGRVAGEPGAAATDVCQAVKNSTYKFARYPTLKLADAVAATTATGKITVAGLPDSGTTTGVNATCNAVAASLKVTISSIKLNGTEILTTPFTYCDGNDTASTRQNNLAEQIRSRIGNGFSAARSNNVLTITTPTGASWNGATLTSTLSGAPVTLTITTAFAGGKNASSTVFAAGRFIRKDIVSGATFANVCIDSAGTITETASACSSGRETLVDRSNRSDCAAKPSCTYAEELANFANWFAWYRSRMQSAKSALSIAFQSVDDRFRVGYVTINSASSNYIKIDNFVPSHKISWYNRLFDAVPTGGTPLRESLANAGRIYAGKKPWSSAVDPVQYSCQKNFTILTTDGYWNGNNGVDLNGSLIGNTDGSLPRPELDGRGDSATLADVAAYYYNTDLRDASQGNCTGALGVSVCANNVPVSSNDPDRYKGLMHQHMKTYTVGLGIPGVMMYRDNYKTPVTDISDDFDAIRTGRTANPTTGVCPWQSSGVCNWPQPGADKQENIDDMWHAAVNAGGTYFSAKDPMILSKGLLDILTSIGTQIGGAAAATTSNPNVTTGDNFVFSSNYITSEWSGELVRQTIDLATGNINPGKDWSAQQKLDAASWSGRTLYTFDHTASGKRKLFTWASLNPTSGLPSGCNPPAQEKGCFMSPWIDAGLTQYCVTGPNCLTAAQKLDASGQNLVDFVRGDKSNEDTSSAQKLYRERKHRLGDIVNSEAVYLGKYLFDYGVTNGYPAKGSSRSDPTVYVAANDGMLHAFNAATGEERWAYIPSMILKDLHRLADRDYPNKHRYFVDGTPVAADVQSGSSWKTILVGGLGAAGAGYYALDVTNQTNPVVLWELRRKTGCTASTSPRTTHASGVTEDCDLGHSFGNPLIGKLPNGTWVVMVTSGLNNGTTSGGNGKGYLYILNALTGNLISKLTTNEGTVDTPSGLMKINGWADDAMKDATIKYVYGGDMLGNLWKFDMTAGGTVSKLYAVGPTKPISAKPELGEVYKSSGQAKRIVFFPTGRLVSNTDLADTSQQTFYAIWDKDGGGAPTALVNATVNVGGKGRTGTTCSSVFDDDNKLGWKLDFPASGERGNTDPQLAFGTLVFSTNAPSSPDPCNPSGFTSWVYNVDYQCGGVVQLAGDANAHIATQYTGAATRPNVVVLPSGTVISITRVSGGSEGVDNKVEQVRIKAAGGGTRRVTWRELLN